MLEFRNSQSRKEFTKREKIFSGLRRSCNPGAVYAQELFISNNIDLRCDVQTFAY